MHARFRAALGAQMALMLCLALWVVWTEQSEWLEVDVRSSQVLHAAERGGGAPRALVVAGCNFRATKFVARVLESNGFVVRGLAQRPLLSDWRSVNESAALAGNEETKDITAPITFRLAAEVLKHTGTNRYQVKDVPEPLRSKVQSAVDQFLSDLISLAPKNDSRAVISLPQAVFFLPFLAQSSATLDFPVGVVIASQNPLEGAYEPGLEAMLGHLSASLVQEDVIDKLCLSRIRPWSISDSIPPFASPSWPDYSWGQRIIPALSTDSNVQQARPCSLVDVSAMRFAMVWSAAHQAVSDDAYMREIGVNRFFAHVDAEYNSIAREVATHFFPSALEESFTLADDKVPPRSWQSKALSNGADQIGVGQVQLLLDQWVLRRLGFFSLVDFGAERDQGTRSLSNKVLHLCRALTRHGGLEASPVYKQVLRRFPAESTKERLDAGHCFQTRTKISDREKHIPTRSVARCLPTFLVLGAQKAGTDELGVWLNKNPNLRRLDGGVEVHFFDCVGRGLGKLRAPCTRVRRSAMTAVSHAAKTKDEPLLGRKKFRWDLMDRHSPIMASWWRYYEALGNVNYPDFHSRKVLTFEKSPAYMDLAHPMDVGRLLPSAKLIFMLRNPVSRFISSYFQSCSGMYAIHHNCSMGDLEQRFDVLTQTGKSYDISNKWVSRDPNSIDYVLRRALEHSLYIVWIDKWRRAFPDKSIMVVFSDHFKRSPLAVMHALESFLGVKRNKGLHIHSVNGYFVVGGGKYSKAHKPSHQSKPSLLFKDKLERFFSPFNQALRNLLKDGGSSIAFRPVQPIPDHIAANFTLPEWLV